MFTTTIAGSLPKPSWLAEPEKLWAAWRLEGADLEQGKRDAALVWIKEQEDAGIDIVTDGEQFRAHFVHGFLEHIDGIDWQRMTEMGIRDDRYTASVPTVTGPVSRPRSVHGDDVAFTRRAEGHPARTDDHLRHHRGCPLRAARRHGDGLRRVAEPGGEGPAFNAFMDDVNEWGVAALEKAAEGLKCQTAVHICYGYGIQQNIDWKETLGSEWRQYEAIFPAINASRINQVSLECANSKVPLSLIGLLKDKQVMVGVIDVASLEVETPEQVAATIEAALPFVDKERLCPCTNCGMAPLPRNVAAAKLQALGAGAALARGRHGG
jgi:5-methyltetrahydropteroyltriglutamate--homocysteine methyltransferase